MTFQTRSEIYAHHLSRIIAERKKSGAFDLFGEVMNLIAKDKIFDDEKQDRAFKCRMACEIDAFVIVKDGDSFFLSPKNKAGNNYLGNLKSMVEHLKTNKIKVVKNET